MNSPKSARRHGDPAAVPVVLKLALYAPIYKREVFSTELEILISDERPSAATQRLARLRSRRPAEKLQQGGRGAQRHTRGDQPSDPRARRGSGSAAVSSTQPCGRADRVGAGAVTRAVGRLRWHPGFGAAFAGA